MKHLSSHREQGFTLVELLVAIAVFVSVMTLSLGAIVNILDAGSKSRAIKSVMTNLNFTVEAISRDIKFGSNYHCGTSSSFPPVPRNCSGIASAESSISFVTSNNENTIYRLQGTQIQKSSNGGTTFIGVTAPDVIVEDLKFYVFNSFPQSGASPDDAQPRVIVVIRGYAGDKPSTQSSFVLQTTLSQRGLDL